MARPSEAWFWEARNCWATTVNGKRHTAPRSIGPKDKKQAQVWYQSIVDGAAPVTVGNLRVADLCELYLAWDVKRVNAKQRCELAHDNASRKLTRVCATEVDGVKVGLIPVTSIKKRHLERMLLEWQSEGLSTNYTRDLGSVFKACFNWGLGEGLIAVYPFVKTPLPRATKAASRYATRQEAAQWLRFLRSQGKRDYGFLQRALIHTGARPSELTRATRDDISWNSWSERSGHKGAIITRTDWKNSRKSDEPRRVYIPASLCRGLKRRMEGPTDRSGHVFTTSRGIAWTAINLSTLTRRMRKLGIEQGLPFKDTADGADCLTCYRWRHTAASSLLMRGVPIAVVGALLGTSAEMIAKTYGHILDESLANAASQL